MQEIPPLTTIFSAHFSWHQARIQFLAQFIIGLIRVRSVNLTEIATAFSGAAQPPSHYRRLQRFFKDFEIDFFQIARLITALLPLESRWVLCLDRTNWKFGKLDPTFVTVKW